MTAVITRFTGITILICIAVIWLTGCGGGDKEGEIMELFARAQELQKDEEFDEAVKIYRRIVREYPRTRKGANSQFMIGYIYANHLKDYEQARIELNRFLEKFSDIADSGLVAGARFEVEYMGKDIDEIPILSDLSQGDTAAAQEEGGGEE